MKVNILDIMVKNIKRKDRYQYKVKYIPAGYLITKAINECLENISRHCFVLFRYFLCFFNVLITKQFLMFIIHHRL